MSGGKGGSDASLSPVNFIKEIYLGLLNNNWSLNDIDEMDIFYYLDVLIYKDIKEYNQNLDKVLSII